MDDTEWEAATSENLAGLLEMADEVLAERQIPVAERPLPALIQLVHWESIAGSDGLPMPLDGSAIAKSDAFKPLARMIGDWYRQRYGQAAMSRAREKLVGFVLARKSPFLLQVPADLAEPGDEPDTTWYRFIDRVLPSEDALTWISDGPDLSGIADISGLRQNITTVANDLRFIHTATLGVFTDGNPDLIAFVHGIGTHLKQAAKQVANQKTQDVVESYWEMQMSGEVALKALLLQRKGAFPHTHSLRTLVKNVVAIDASFPADCLGKFPDDRETIKRRYGTGNVSWEQTFSDYLVLLALVRNATERMKRMDLGKASLCLHRAPWI